MHHSNVTKNHILESDLKTIGLLETYGQCDTNVISSTGRSDDDMFGSFSNLSGFEEGNNGIEDIKDLTASSPLGTKIKKKYFPMKDFPHNSNLGMIRLSENRWHTCNYCNKTFQSHQQLQQHNLVHSGERKYRCSYCDRAFKQLSHLQQHHRTHTGEKPYRCPLDGCGRAFPQLSNLQHHLRKHDKMVTSGHLCCICGHSCPSEALVRTQVLNMHHAETVSGHSVARGVSQSELLAPFPTGRDPTTLYLQVIPQNMHLIKHSQSAANCPEWSAIPNKCQKSYTNIQVQSLFGLNAVQSPAQKTERHLQQRKEPNFESILNAEQDIYFFNKRRLFDKRETSCFPKRNAAAIQKKSDIQITASCVNSSFSLLHENLLSKINIFNGEKINQEFESSIKTGKHQSLECHNTNQRRDTITKLDKTIGVDASMSREQNAVLYQDNSNDFLKDNQVNRMKQLAMQDQEHIMCNKICNVGNVCGTSRSRRRKLANPKRIYQRDLSTSESFLSDVV